MGKQGNHEEINGIFVEDVKQFDTVRESVKSYIGIDIIMDSNARKSRKIIKIISDSYLMTKLVSFLYFLVV